MIRVEHKKFAEYIFKREQNLISQTDVSVFDARRNLCTPGFIAFAFAVVFTLLTFFSRVAFLLLLTEMAALAALYFHTLFMARKLAIKRVLSTKPYREMDSIEVIIEIRNRASWELSGLIVEDRFGCSKNSHVRTAPDVVRPRAMLRFSYKRVCDGGMGRHKIGPLTARVSDPIGIFEFRVIEDTVLDVEVYPRIEQVPMLPVRASVDGARYGNYEVASRGLSVNFTGVRPYESGDSLRHIAWKLSGRGQGLMVKEFEKVVSCDVNVVLNLSPQFQIGRHSTSTWECAKDIALTSIQQQLELGNTVGLFTDRSFVEHGCGGDHFHKLTRHISSMTTVPEIEGPDRSARSLLEKYHSFFPRGSNVIYITPFNLIELEQSEPWLKRYKAEGYTVICVFVDTNSFWLDFLESISTGLLIGARLMLGVVEASDRLQQHGIQTYIVKNRQPLHRAFRESQKSVST